MRGELKEGGAGMRCAASDQQKVDERRDLLQMTLGGGHEFVDVLPMCSKRVLEMLMFSSQMALRSCTVGHPESSR